MPASIQRQRAYVRQSHTLIAWRHEEGRLYGLYQTFTNSYVLTKATVWRDSEDMLKLSPLEALDFYNHPATLQVQPRHTAFPTGVLS